MADYIYLLENRLSPAQRSALSAIRELAKSKNLTVFLVGGAVRDLTTGSPVRDLDVVVQGNASRLKREIEKAGGTIIGENDAAQAVYVAFPGGVRLEISSTLAASYPKPGKPVYKSSGIQDDLRRRDFTANAMALSLNEGSYGLLMDPLNGIADIENRELRLVSNYGFIEDPVRMLRATRLMARLGWTMDEKTAQRYEAGKEEGYISALSEIQRGYEAEEVIHEEDPLRVIQRLEAEGWMTHLAPFWTSAKADVAALEQLREVQTQLQMQGIHPDPSAANFPLLTAKLSASEVASLKSSFVRPGFVKEIESLEASAKELATLLTNKAASLPSQSWKIITSAAPEAVLWVAYSTRSSALQAKFKAFSTVWPQARQKMPYALMQEMRIVPELPGYNELLEALFFELMDDKLQTSDEMKAFLEPFSPPAPPPPVSTRRPRAPKKESKAAKARAKKAIVVAGGAEDADNSELTEELEEVLTEALDASSEEDENAETAALKGENDDEDEEDEADEEPVRPGQSASLANPAKISPSGSRTTASAGSKPAPDTLAGARKDFSVKPPSEKGISEAPVAPKSAAAKPGLAKSDSAKTTGTKTTAAKTTAAKTTAAKASSAKSTSAKSTSVRSAGKGHTAPPAKKVPAKPTTAVKKAAAPAKTAAKSSPSAQALKSAAKKPVLKSAPAKKVPGKKVAAPAPAPARKGAPATTAKKAAPPKRR